MKVLIFFGLFVLIMRFFLFERFMEVIYFNFVNRKNFMIEINKLGKIEIFVINF